MNKNDKLVELLSNTLEEDEKILTWIDGAFETKVNEKSNVKTGILALTSKKIRFCGKRFIFVYDDVVEYDDLLEVSLTEERLGFNIFMKGKEKPYFMKYVISEKVHKFVEELKEKIKQ